MIFTIFFPDGRKERRPVGYGGGLCEKATAPYEKRDVPNAAQKSQTAEALEPPAVREVTESEMEHQG